MVRGTSQTDAAFSTKQLDLAGSTTINLLSTTITTQMPLWHASLLSVCFYLYFFCFFDGENKGGNYRKLTWRRIMENSPLLILLNHCYSSASDFGDSGDPQRLTVRNFGLRRQQMVLQNWARALILVAQPPSSTHFVA